MSTHEVKHFSVMINRVSNYDTSINRLSGFIVNLATRVYKLIGVL